VPAQARSLTTTREGEPVEATLIDSIPGKSPVRAQARAINEWLHINPLRQWRRRTGTTMSAVAILVGVSLTAIQKWEGGLANPSDVNMTRLATLMEAPDLATEWADWNAAFVR
jgi:DNA-binding transcriptional regulator YiaG